MLPKLDVAHTDTQSNRGEVCCKSSRSHRRRALRVLFVQLDADVMESCSRELDKAQFTVKSDFALSLTQSTEQLRVQPADVMIVEYPSPSCKESQVLELIQSAQATPLIFLTTRLGTESITALLPDASFEYVEQGHLARLPMAVRRVLNEAKLRCELEDAKKALRHSQSLYRALADNPTYGIYRCDADGELLDVNLALVTMLGYASKVELLATNQQSEIIPNLRNDSLLAGLIPDTKRIEPVELE